MPSNPAAQIAPNFSGSVAVELIPIEQLAYAFGNLSTSAIDFLVPVKSFDGFLSSILAESQVLTAAIVCVGLRHLSLHKRPLVTLDGCLEMYTLQNQLLYQIIQTSESIRSLVRPGNCAFAFQILRLSNLKSKWMSNRYAKGLHQR
jgi:hypothetical protein